MLDLILEDLYTKFGITQDTDISKLENTDFPRLEDLYYLLEMSDKIIYLDIPKRTRNVRIFTRFIKQKLKIEKSNYKPTLKMLKLMVLTIKLM